MEQDLKHHIMDVTIQLIREFGDVSKITVRDICARANVGVGLVNYHFQTKNNLINQCIQKIIGNIINGFDALAESLDLNPYEKLRYLIKLNAKFLVENVGISKISIAGDILSGSINDNSVQTLNAYYRLLKKIYGDKKTDNELKAMLFMVISTLQVAFLRHKVLNQTDGMDFFNEKQRDGFIDLLVEKVFHDLKK